MKPEKYEDFSGFMVGELIIVCQGFRNPIYQKEWPGFVISVYDSDPFYNLISTSEILSFDATTFEPAIITRNDLTIIPSNFEIA